MDNDIFCPSPNSCYFSLTALTWQDGGLQPKKTERYRKFQIWDWFFFGFFGFSILANFDWFNGFLLVVLFANNSKCKTFAGLYRH